MALTPGTRLGPYEVVAPLGAGGMGEVYRARDTRLGRDVALKVLPASLAKDEDRLRRFEHEARAAGALNHPNLLTVFDVGREEGAPYIVSELLEGSSLRTLLAGSGLPQRKMLEHAVQIAGGLAAAHDKGILHRDLKPENLFVTKDGRVKILDFGLAKLTRPADGFKAEADAATVTSPTTPGTVLGTVGYMSPEQVQGLAVDARSDIFSFGAVLYEMLSGRRAFKGATAVETMNAILKEDPPELSGTTPPLPPALERIVRRCLEKNADERFRSAHDVAFALEALSGPSTEAPPAARMAQKRLGLRSRWVAAGMLLGTLATLFIGRGFRGRSSSGISHLSVAIPTTDRLFIRSPIALSRDGQRLVYSAYRGEVMQLYARELNRFETRPLPGTETGWFPFFSSDGRWVAFASGKDNKLDAVSLEGGRPRIIAENVFGGASWGDDGTIVFAPSWNGGLRRGSSAGGPSQPLTTLDARTEAGHVSPQVLPGGRAVLFTVRLGRTYDDARIESLELDTSRRRVVVEGSSYARYVETGHVLYGRASNLMAAAFDLKELKVVGPSVTLVENVTSDAGNGTLNFAASSSALAYVPGRGGRAERMLVWVDRKGRATPVTDLRRAYGWASLSPDGARIAVHVVSGAEDLWTYDLARGTLTRLTFANANAWPLWTRDGRRLIFATDRDGANNLYWMPAEGGRAERLTTSPMHQAADSVSPDGRNLVFEQFSPLADLWILPLEGDRKPRPFLESPFNKKLARFSPDGRWLAYQSDESGRFEVYIQAFPGPGGKRLVSVDGGTGPAWAPDGREIYFLQGHTLMAARVGLGSPLSISRPEALFEAPDLLVEEDVAPDVAADGRFLMIRQSDEETSSREIRILLDWAQELKTARSTLK